jgi:multiple sugar transport system permease protein
MGFGLFPALYILYLSFIKPHGGFAGLSNFLTVAADFRFASTFLHIATYSLAFIVPSLIISVGIGLLMQGRRAGSAALLQVVYYLPQGLVGAAGVVVWLFMLTPSVSPVGLILRHFGYHNIIQVVDAANLAVILAIIAVWTSGNSILLIYSALKSIPGDLIEAAHIDGANAWHVARRVKLPMLRKWIAYVVILNAAAAIQVFAEPVLISTATSQGIGSDWSPLQLAYTYAYRYVNFPAAAALALQLLAIGTVISILVVKFTSLFEVEI